MTEEQADNSAATGGSSGCVTLVSRLVTVGLVCPVDPEEAGFPVVTNGVDRVPTMALASIVATTDQSQHTLTATIGGRNQYRCIDNLQMTKR